MALNTKTSDALFAQAQDLMPGGVNSPVRAFRAVNRNPLFIDHAKGDRIFDVDGNEFIDYVCSWGPGILGHAHPRVIEAVQKACTDGLTFGAPTKKESALAERIKDAFPVVEKVRLVSSGTEAVMSAVRAARGYTGRDLILKFVGCYHGHSDGLLVRSGSGLLTNAVPDSGGVPKSYTDCTLVAEYNDPQQVQDLFDAYPDRIACVIVEPVAANMGVVPPQDGFLEFLRTVTEKNGSLLIFDEVITGFRLAYGGACEFFGIRPDLVTLGKIVGGGMPLAAYGGRREVMDCISPQGPVYQAGTLSGNPVATTAGIMTLDLLREDPEIYARIDEKAAKIEQALLDTGKVTVNRVGSLLSAFFTEGEIRSFPDVDRSDLQAFSRYFNAMLEQGIYVAPSQFEAMFVSDAHTAEDIEETCNVIRSLSF